MRSPTVTALAVALILVTAACSGGSSPATIRPAPGEVVLMTHDSFALSPDTLDRFTVETGIDVSLLQSGDAGAMLSQAILTKDSPLADVIYGIDNTFLSRAEAEGIFAPYVSPELESVPAELRAGDDVTPIDFGYVCVNYDRSAFASASPPQTLADLTKPAYRDMLVVEDPASSSPGLAFLLATIAEFGDTGGYTWQDYWADLAANGVLVTSGWTEAYEGSFTAGGGGGDRPIVVSYASSPAVGVYFTDPPPAEAPTAAMLDGCFRQVEYAGVVAGSRNPEGAAQLIDFLLSIDVQEDIPLNMFVYPANRDAALPQVFIDFSEVPTDPATLDPAVIEANRKTWINEWTDIVR
jgi:thiamine transport system substrate-binding protein